MLIQNNNSFYINRHYCSSSEKDGNETHVIFFTGHIGENACYTINCGSNYYIQITYAHYGIRYWCDASNEVGVLNSRCLYKSSCQVCATNGWFGDPCVGTYKYMWFNWDCKSKGRERERESYNYGCMFYNGRCIFAQCRYVFLVLLKL